jgi:hypothetical protein
MRKHHFLREISFWLMLVLLAFAINACFSPSKEKPSNTDETTFETEEEEMDRLGREKEKEEEKVYGELGMYNGTYTIKTESEAVEASLDLKYNGDKTFSFTWFFAAADLCEAKYSGLILMDQTQHGFYNDNECTLHFNFMGSWGGSLVVEIDHNEVCPGMKGECIFSGTYLKSE